MAPSSGTHKILNIKQAQLDLGGATYGGAVLDANITATVEDLAWQPISGEDQYETGEPEHTLNVNFGQDLSTDTTLTAFLMSKHGQTVPFKLYPKGDTTGPSAEGTVTVKFPSQVGGARGVATATSAMRVNGQPVIKAANGTQIYPAAEEPEGAALAAASDPTTLDAAADDEEPETA